MSSRQRKLIMAFGAPAGEIPEAVDFDGNGDFLSRAGDFTGNTDSKVFTFSFWVYISATGDYFIVSYSADRFRASLLSDNSVNIQGRNSAGTLVLNATIPAGTFTKQTTQHCLVSVDMDSASNRGVRVSDRNVSASWDTYTIGQAIDFTGFPNNIGAATAGASKIFGRLGHVFLDYTYRDLSIEANRRLFITEDLKPTPVSTLKALGPIAYFPMTDPDNIHINEGIGGDMVLTGTIARSGRGPNQWNCVASFFDGAGDYLKLTYAQAGVTAVTFSMTFKRVSNEFVMLTETQNGYVELEIQSDGGLICDFNSPANAVEFSLPAGTLVENVEYSLQLSFDTSSASLRAVVLNGKVQTPTYAYYVIDSTITFGTTLFIMQISGETNPALGELGEYWFDTTYTDLLTDNPFWDSYTNRPKPVRQVIAETGVTPLVALPLSADNAGLNLGSESDFTVVSGPFVGARGASEYWARSVAVDGTNYLTLSSTLCASLIKFTSADAGVTWVANYLNNVTVTDIGNGTDNGLVAYYFGTSEVITWNEENKLRFVDAFGYPLPPELDSNTLIFLDFSDPDNYGANQGSVADATETGTVTPGPDVDPN